LQHDGLIVVEDRKLTIPDEAALAAFADQHQDLWFRHGRTSQGENNFFEMVCYELNHGSATVSPPVIQREPPRG
jgi:hypothetical protein